MKKIWFDLSNAPHVNMFEQLINDLQNKGHEIIITCRPLSNTVDLLNLKGLSYEVVGIHYGKNILMKIFGYPIRVYQLYRYLKNKKIDIAISQSSFHSPLTAWLLGVSSIYMNDNEHAVGNIPSFIFADKILLPEYFEIKKAKKQFAKSNKIIQYPGVKEGIYLWNSLLVKKKESRNIYIRPEPWLAQYYEGGTEFLDNIILELKDIYNIIVLPRGEDQAKHFNKDMFSGITVQTDVLSLLDIATECALFIGAGGTMTREMAVLGIPTISVYQGEILDVDKYLVSADKMLYLPNLNTDKVKEFMQSKNTKKLDKELSEKGKKSYDLIKKIILDI